MKVADSRHANTLQPRARVPLIEAVAEILDDAPRHEPSGFPEGYCYRDLASQVYGVDDPTAAQLSAVRRAVAKLVAQGRAVRDLDGRGRFWDYGGSGRYHFRRNSRYVCRSPTGIRIFRPMTAEDQEARDVAGARFFAEVKAGKFAALGITASNLP
jgi:hypothetical protein